MKKDEIIKLFVSNGYLLSPDFIQNIDKNKDYENFLERINQLKNKPTIINNDLFLLLNKGDGLDINWNDFDLSKAYYEMGRNEHNYNVFLDIIGYNISEEKRNILNELAEEIKEPEENFEDEKYEESENVIILKNYKGESKKKEAKDFVDYFKKKYEYIKKILTSRSELDEAISIRNIFSKENNSIVSIVGCILSKNYTKNNNIILEVEDLTGKINVIISKEREEVFNIADDLVEDEVIAISGSLSKGVIFANTILLPDIPNTFEFKKSPDLVYAGFIGDLHVGLNKFMGKNFNRFLNWLNGDCNGEDKEIVDNLKYLFIVGDVVEGVGIYPGQENDLIVKDVYEQYGLIARLLSKIPKHIYIVMCGGNHDAMRISEPQPIFDKKFAKSLLELPNLIVVSNPSLVNIHASKDFPGINILLYHGFSFPYYADKVQSIKLKGGLSRPDLVMEFLLKRRHLAPNYNSTPIDPSLVEYLVIDKVPDIFVSGHIHRLSVSQYKNITCINASCWATQTEDQEKRGIIPDPAKVVILNLKTREHRVIDFENDV